MGHQPDRVGSGWLIFRASERLLNLLAGRGSEEVLPFCCHAAPPGELARGVEGPRGRDTCAGAAHMWNGLSCDLWFRGPVSQTRARLRA